MPITTLHNLNNAAGLRLARHASGFGCIRCGTTIFSYCTRADPAAGPIAPEDIFLLCPPCLRTLSRQPERARTIEVLRRAPVTRQRDFDRDRLPYLAPERGLDIPDITVGPEVLMRATSVPILFGETPVVAIRPPEVTGGAILLDIVLGDGVWQPVQVVRGNEWVAPREGWRFERWGQRYVIGGRKALLVLGYTRGRGFKLERLSTYVSGRRLEVGAEGVTLNSRPIHLPSQRERFIGIRL